MKNLQIILPGTLLFACLLTNAGAQTNVLTYRYDNARTGANMHEMILNPVSVASGFGKLYSRAVDGLIYAQPLYVPNVNVPGKGIHNVVYVVTMNDVIYAFDADSNTGANADPLWTVSLVNPAAGVTPVPSIDVSTGVNITGNVGIESTPVIDTASNTIYLVARTKENAAYVQRLHALDITSGAERPHSPAIISGSVPGTAPNNVNLKVTFDPAIHNQRAGLALTNGKVLISWASHEDLGPYHGWIMTYDAVTLAQSGIVCTTPNGSEGGIWMGGWAPSIDDSNFAYFSVGNGDWDGKRNFGESVVRLVVTPRLAIVDFFTPSDWPALNDNDDDLGSTGFMLIPGLNSGVAIGKKSKLYIVNTKHMGWTAAGDTVALQTFDLHTLNPSIQQTKSGPVYWNRPGGLSMLFIEGEDDYVRGIPVNNSGGVLSLPTDPAVSINSAPYYAPDHGGGVLTLSGDSAGQTAILWSSTTAGDSGDGAPVAGVLRAFDASNGLTELWNSNTNQQRDDAGNWAKFVPPLVVNGRVYIATFSNQLNVYGLLNQ